eukprot:TRINITY_DN2008_c0_g1_i1.p1 TRINITY_DN2008_c0_g1~~TRINITY_DN2008_c0_g1_i1.p1  ORF type:complete len:671 (+),score=159.93 TRINITY_DN2008_c0_g1_i1:184-2196(+)
MQTSTEQSVDSANGGPAIMPSLSLSSSSENGIPVHTEVLLRRPNINKTALKEKFVAVFEALFVGQNPAAGNPNFWKELFLLKVNIPYLERCIVLTSEEQLLILKDNMNLIFISCCEILDDDNKIRVAHAMETLSIFLKSIFRKKFNNFGYDVKNIVVGIERSDTVFKNLLQSVRNILLGNEASLKPLALTLLIIIVTAADNINQNTLIEHFMVVDMFDPIIQIFVEPSTRKALGFDAIFLLSVLVNYRKHEAKNMYIEKMASIKSREVLESIANVVEVQCADCNNFYAAAMLPKSGIYGKLTSYLWSMIPIGSEAEAKSISPSNTGAVLLALYELVNLNRDFFTLLLTTEPPATTKLRPSPSGNSLVPPPSKTKIIPQFFQFCSFLFTDVKDVRSVSYAKLCLIILEILTEDKQTARIMHSNDLNITVPIFIKSKNTVVETKKPLACVTLDLMIQFLKHNLKKAQMDLYSKCLGCIHRLLAFEKQNQIMLDYKWIDLWEALLKVVKYISSEEIFKNPEIIALSAQIARIFNLFITHGQVLVSPSAYDELYYELVRNQKILDHFFATVNQVDAGGSLMQDWSNVKTIVHHFGQEFDEWCKTNTSTNLTPQQVRVIIRSKYETLRLKFHENLEHFEPYIENPKEVSFFRQLMRVLVFDFKTLIEVNPVQVKM